jgi:hypothetical protein
MEAYGGHTTTPKSVSGCDIPHSYLHAGCGCSLANSSQKAALEDHRAHAEEQTYSSWRWEMPHPSPKIPYEEEGLNSVSTIAKVLWPG